MRICHLKFNLFIIACLPIIGLVQADSNLNQAQITSEKVSDLAFSNCNELESLLKTQVHQMQAFDKLKLAENLSKIISLKTINSNQFPSSPGGQFNPKAFDVALTLNPNSENKAKECAIKNLPLLTPESVISIPDLLASARDNSLPRQLRVAMLSQARKLSSEIKEPLKDYTLTALLTQIKNNKQILNDYISIPSLLPIITYHRDAFREMALSTKSNAISYALRILDPEGNIEVPALLKQIELNNSETNKVFILKSLVNYPSHLNDILNSLPLIAPSLNSSELDTLIDSLNLVANTSISKTPETIADAIAEPLLTMLPISNEKQLEGITHIFRETNLNSGSGLCSANLLQKEQTNLSIAQRISLARICSKKNVDLKFLKSLYKTNSLDNLIVALILVSKNDQLRKSSLEEVYTKLETLKPTIAPKEYREAGNLLVAIENTNPSSNSKATFIKLAETLLSEDPIYPSVAKEFLNTLEHPSITLLASLGKKSVPTISKLLKNSVSPALRQRGLTVVGSESYVAYPELLETVESLIADEDLDTRRQAYQILSRRSSMYPTSAKIKLTKNTSSQFYKARLNLQFLDKKSVKDRGTSASLLFSALIKLKCQESTVPLTGITTEDISAIAPGIKENAEIHLIQCLKEKGQIGRRAIDTLELLAPLSTAGKKNFEELLSKEKLPQLSAEEGTKYFNLIYSNSTSITQIPKEVFKNLLAGTSIKDQVLYSIWLMSRLSGTNEIRAIIEEYFDSSVKKLVELALSRREEKSQTRESDLDDSLDQVFDLLNKNGRDLSPLINQFSDETRIGLIKKGENNLDPNELLSLKHLVCPSIAFKDCNISEVPLAENILENPDYAIEEIILLLDRKINDSEVDKNSINAAISLRLEALIQLGRFNHLVPNKANIKIVDSLGNLALHAKDNSTKLIAKFLQITLAPK